MIYKTKNGGSGIFRLESYSWNSGSRDDWACNHSLFINWKLKIFFAPSLVEAAFHKLFPPHDLGVLSTSLLFSSLPFSHPRKAVDDLKADGIGLEALGTPGSDTV